MRFLQPVSYLHNNSNGNNGNLQHITSSATPEVSATTNNSALTDGHLATITNNATINGINDINSGSLNGNTNDTVPLNRLTSHEYITNYDNNDDHSNVTISDNVSFNKHNQNIQNLTRYQNSEYFHNNINQLNRTLINDNERSFYSNITSTEQVPNNVESLIQSALSEQKHLQLNDINHHHTTNLIRRENLAKLDLDTNNRQRNRNRRRVGGSSSICSESSPDDSFMDEEDAFSATPSSCASLSSPEPNFPRGIINPNYPGFQHLAHTLSEHFIDHNFEHSSDSDISEFEVELSRENLYRVANNERYNNLNNNVPVASELPDNGNDSVVNNFNIPVKHVQEIKSFCTKEVNNDDCEENSYVCAEENSNEHIVDEITTAVAEMCGNRRGSDNGDEEDGFDANCTTKVGCEEKRTDQSCMLESYLKNIEPSPVETIYAKPDILLENDEIKYTNNGQDGNHKPDLLQNVFTTDSNTDANLVDNITEATTGTCINRLDIVVPDELNLSKTVLSKEEEGTLLQWTTSPVDIVGNFGQEVEREIGLIVSGYKSREENCHSELSKEISIDTANILSGIDKTTDAVLSNAKETIQLSEIGCDLDLNLSVTFSDTLTISSAETSQLVDEPPSTGEPPLENFPQPKQLVTPSTTPPPPPPPHTRNHIPTAIVKPKKYQRTSHDDRQLPPVVCIDREKSWFDNNNESSAAASSNTVSTERSRKIQLLPTFERKHRKISRGSTTNNKLVPTTATSQVFCSEKEKLNALRQCSEKDIDSSGCTSSASVAIVTPQRRCNREKLAAMMMDSMRHSGSGLMVGSGDKKKRSTSPKSVVTCINNNSKGIHYNNNNNGGVSSIRNGCSAEKTKGKGGKDPSASFDVYNIETALPIIDLEAIENHLKAAKEEEKKRRNDREEIRRRLAMGAEDDYLSNLIRDRPGRKPSLQSRLQSGMNLQICFMNETASDTESPSSDSETCPKLSRSASHNGKGNGGGYQSRYSSSTNPYNSRPLSVNIKKPSINTRPSTLSLGPPPSAEEIKESDFFTKQARLQIEARMALAQAKDMAHMQMEIDRQKQKESPITEVIRNSLQKVGIPFPPEKRRVSRQMLTDMNIAQLQVIVNELHTQIERLNENLVQFLMERDELHMSQDSMLVDIEDLTRYLSAKEQAKLGELPKSAALSIAKAALANSKATPTRTISCSSVMQQQDANSQQNQSQQNTQNKLLRMASLVKK